MIQIIRLFFMFMSSLSKIFPFPTKAEFVYFLPLISCFLLFSELGESLWRTNGHYHFRRFLYLFFAFTLFIFGSYLKKSFKKLEFTEKHRRLIFILPCLVLSYFCFKMGRKHLVGYIELKSLGNIITGSNWLLFSLSLSLFFVKAKSYIKNTLIFMIVILFLTKVLTIFSSPSPYMDVFTIHTQGAKYLLEGINPYGAKYIDIYGGKYNYEPGFSYWPMALIAQTFAYKLFGDIRFCLVIADLLILIGFFKLFKVLNFTTIRSLLFIVLWFAFPVQNFITEQAWVDPVLVSALVWTSLFLLQKRWIYCGIALGIACATKQYGPVFAVILGLIFLKEKKFKELTQIVLYSLLSFSILMLPFVLWNPDGFYYMSVANLMGMDFRTDSFSLIAVLNREFGIIPHKLLYSLPSLIGLILSIWWSKNQNTLYQKVMGVSIIVFSLTFFFGKQAFCNYYYLLSIFVFLYLAIVDSFYSNDPNSLAQDNLHEKEVL